jgi:long-subunit acyl-CoA synthetase (AMP-forming)
MANGETIVPVPIEGALLAHPLVKGAMVFGRGRDQIGMFIEPVQDNVYTHQFLNDIWCVGMPTHYIRD